MDLQAALAQSSGSDPAVLTIDEATMTVFSSLRTIIDNFLQQLPLILAGLVIIGLTAALDAIARRITVRLLRDAAMRTSLKELIGRFVDLTVWFLGLLLAAMVMFPGLTPSRALAALGLGSIAVGLAFKDIFENLFAGVFILWRFPFENGDFITCKGITGQVERVTVRNTLLRTVRGELIVMPNADIYKNPVDILTSRDQRRQEVICGVAYGENVGAAREVIAKAVKSCQTVSEAYGIEIFAQEFASSSINFEVAWWSGADPLSQRESRDEVVDAVKSALDEAGIEIPFPYRTLTFKHPLGIHQAQQDDGEAE